MSAGVGARLRLTNTADAGDFGVTCADEVFASVDSGVARETLTAAGAA